MGASVAGKILAPRIGPHCPTMPKIARPALLLGKLP